MGEGAGTSIHPLEALLVAAVAIHFANYYFSARSKIGLGGRNPWAWLLENPTHHIALVAQSAGIFSIGGSSAFGAFMNRLMEQSNVFMNASTLLVEAAGVVAIFWRRASISLTFLLSALHIGIFLASGIFFWKWLLFNTGIAYALTRAHVRRFPLWLGTLALFALFASERIFDVARLGWIDSGKVNLSRIYAVSETGKVDEVPTNYFLDKSVAFAQFRPSIIVEPRLPVGIWGGTRKWDRLYDRTMCERPLEGETKVNEDLLRRVEGVIREHHRFILDRVDGSGRFDFDWYPHHIWSAPFRFGDFHKLDKRTIVRYILVVESQCLDMALDGRPEPKVVRRWEYAIPLGSSGR